MPGFKPTPPAERLAGKYEVDTETGCWVWKASRSREGYGRLSGPKSPLYAHRVSYELHVGPIPEGLHIDHLCRNRACINPAHLEPVTCKENMHRGQAPTVMMALANRCKHGHDLSVYAYYRADGNRHCGECNRQRSRARYYRLKAQGIDPNERRKQKQTNA